MLSKYILTTIALLLRSVSAFTNPIISGVNADPSAIRVGSDYFLVTSSFEYFPGLPIYHSRNLVDWELIGHGLTERNGIIDRGLGTLGGIYAPTLRHHNGTFYLVTNYLGGGPTPFLITTDDIFSGNWSRPLYFDQTGIDPDLFFDDDGSVYLSTSAPEYGPLGGNSTIWQSKVDLITGHSLTQPRSIFRSSLPPEIRATEGPHLYKINGTYYLSVADGGTERFHRQIISKGSSPSGPWEESPLDPLVFNSRDPTAPVQQTGHADLIVRPDGKWYTVFLAVRPQLPQNINGTFTLGRETFLSPVTWSEDGWPLANNGSLITFTISDPDLPSQSINNTIWRDDFSSPTLAPGWEFREPPYANWYRVFNSSLILRGRPSLLSQIDGTALILRRQDALFYSFSVEIEFQPTLNSHEAGIVAWVNDQHHNTISITLCPNQTETCLKTAMIAQTPLVDGNVTTTYYPLPSHSAAVRLHIRSTPETYQFGYSLRDTENVTWLTAISASDMAPRVSGRISWDGARVGMYATGNGVAMLEEAVFRRVRVVRGT